MTRVEAHVKSCAAQRTPPSQTRPRSTVPPSGFSIVGAIELIQPRYRKSRASVQQGQPVRFLAVCSSLLTARGPREYDPRPAETLWRLPGWEIPLSHGNPRDEGIKAGGAVDVAHPPDELSVRRPG